MLESKHRRGGPTASTTALGDEDFRATLDEMILRYRFRAPESVEEAAKHLLRVSDWRDQPYDETKKRILHALDAEEKRRLEQKEEQERWAALPLSERLGDEV